MHFNYILFFRHFFFRKMHRYKEILVHLFSKIHLINCIITSYTDIKYIRQQVHIKPLSNTISKIHCLINAKKKCLTWKLRWICLTNVSSISKELREWLQVTPGVRPVRAPARSVVTRLVIVLLNCTVSTDFAHVLQRIQCVSNHHIYDY